MDDTTTETDETNITNDAKLGGDNGTTDTSSETPTSDSEGRGSKNAVLADLARERDKRHQLEKQFAEFRDGLGKALGLTQDEQPTPEQLTRQLAESQAATRAAQTQLAVLQNLPDGVDREALLDSTAFHKVISDATPDTIADTITTFVEQHPRFKTKPAGMRDLNTPTTTSDPVDPIAAALTAAVGQRHR